MDRLTEKDSAGEFSEVEQPFRQYPLSQTDLLAFFVCQQTHLLLSVCQLTRIVFFPSICVCFHACAVCLRVNVNHRAAVCQC